MYAVSHYFWIIILSKILFASILPGNVTSKINREYCLMDWKLILDLVIALKISTKGLSGLLTFRWMLNGFLSYIFKRKSLNFLFLLPLKQSTCLPFHYLYHNFPDFLIQTPPVELRLVLSSPWLSYDSVTDLVFRSLSLLCFTSSFTDSLGQRPWAITIYNLRS
jgi:hypothetical protein